MMCVHRYLVGLGHDVYIGTLWDWVMMCVHRYLVGLGHGNVYTGTSGLGHDPSLS